MRVLVPGPYIDKDFVRQAGRAVYEQLLDGGVRVYEYCPTMMFERDLERSEEIDLQRWNGRPLVNEIAEGLTKVARREL
jgi:hypothetical protein